MAQYFYFPNRFKKIGHRTDKSAEHTHTHPLQDYYTTLHYATLYLLYCPIRSYTTTTQIIKYKRSTQLAFP